MSNQLPPRMVPSNFGQNQPSHYNTTAAQHHSTTNTQQTNGRNGGWKQGRGNHRGKGRGRHYRGRNNPRPQQHGTYYQQQYQQPVYACPGQVHHPFVPHEQVFQQPHPNPPHYRQFSAQEQNDYEHLKYHGHHRQHSDTHYNLSPVQQQNLHMQKYHQQQNLEPTNDQLWEEFQAFDTAYTNLIQQGVYTTRGEDFRAAYNHIYGRNMKRCAPRVREIRKGVIETVLHNGCVEYRYMPGYAPASVKLRGGAPEFIPSQETVVKAGRGKVTSGVVLPDGGKDENEKKKITKYHEKDEKENGAKNEKEIEHKVQHSQAKSDEEGEDTILTQLPDTFLEADKVGRATTVGTDDFVYENGTTNIDISHDPAGFIMKKVSQKERVGCS